MTDRELLEKAAKAHGGVNFGCERWYDSATDDVWNPLEDDGDALRLAVKLSLLDSPEMWSYRSIEYFVKAVPDPYAATRRAIVRAAASLAGD